MAAGVNLYLCTDEVASEMDVLTAKARGAVENGVIKWLEKSVDGFDKALLLILKPISNDPKWVEFLNVTFPEVESVQKNRSSGAVAYIETSGDKFVIPFGTGYFSLDERKLVNDFGLMVTANSVLEDSLRFLDSNNPSAGTKSRVQVDRLSGASGFDLDSALAFIKKLGGIAQGDDFGKSLSGSTGFKFTGPAEFSLLKPKLDRAKAMYGSDIYKQRGLDIIAAMKPVTNPSLVQGLDSGIIPHLRADDGEFVLASPTIIEWDEVGVFRYGGWRDRHEHADLSVTDYIGKLQTIDYENWDSDTDFLDDLKSKHTITVHRADDGSLLKQWNVYRCLQGSIDHEGDRYSLSDGRWFLVAANFREAIENTFSRCREDVNDTEFPKAVLVEKIMKKGKKAVPVEGVESEGSYNERAANLLGFMYLDKETGSVPGIANQRNELCDLLSFSERRLIHVKKGSRSSGALHHLFRQGATAARMLRDPAFLKSISDRLRVAEREQDAKEVDQLATGNNQIEFRIIDKPRSSGDFDIPFFAKVALHYAVREILESGNTAKLGFINHSD